MAKDKTVKLVKEYEINKAGLPRCAWCGKGHDYKPFELRGLLGFGCDCKENGIHMTTRLKCCEPTICEKHSEWSFTWEWDGHKKFIPVYTKRVKPVPMPTPAPIIPTPAPQPAKADTIVEPIVKSAPGQGDFFLKFA